MSRHNSSHLGCKLVLLFLQGILAGWGGGSHLLGGEQGCSLVSFSLIQAVCPGHLRVAIEH